MPASNREKCSHGVNQKYCFNCKLESKLPVENINGHHYVRLKDLNPYINQLLVSQKTEHCSEPKCPECNMAAYNKGKEDMKAEIEKELEIVHKCLTDLYSHSDNSVGDRIKKCLKAIKSLTEKGDEL